jgi:hypothetical protein
VKNAIEARHVPHASDAALGPKTGKTWQSGLRPSTRQAFARDSDDAPNFQARAAVFSSVEENRDPGMGSLA